MLELHIIYWSMLPSLLQPVIASFRDHSAADSASRARCQADCYSGVSLFSVARQDSD
jgi:hypothetical protein